MLSDAEFSETDFGRAVFLGCQPTVRLVRVHPISLTRVAFIFTPATECQRLAALYATDQVQCSPRLILDRARAMKSLLHQAKNPGGAA